MPSGKQPSVPSVYLSITSDSECMQDYASELCRVNISAEMWPCGIVCLCMEQVQGLTVTPAELMYM